MALLELCCCISELIQFPRYDNHGKYIYRTISKKNGLVDFAELRKEHFS